MLVYVLSCVSTLFVVLFPSCVCMRVQMRSRVPVPGPASAGSYGAVQKQLAAILQRLSGVETALTKETSV